MKISALSSDKINKCKYLTGEETLRSAKSILIKPAQFIYSPWGKAFEKQTKTIKEKKEKNWKEYNTIKNS